MNKNVFIKKCADIFAAHSFYRKGNTFYYDSQNGILVVFGLQKSNYGPYYYLECGFVFTEINKHLPYPKHYELDVNLGRVMTSLGKALCYESMGELEFGELYIAVKDRIDTLCSVADRGKQFLVQQFFCPPPKKVSYLLQGTAEYLDINVELLREYQIPIVED